MDRENCADSSRSKKCRVIKPLAQGKHIRKWAVKASGLWLIVTKIGIDIKRYPAVLAHLKKWQIELEARWDQGDHG
jgi:adenine-specific DNA-methyltransferase